MRQNEEALKQGDGLGLVCIPGRTDDEPGTWFVCLADTCCALAPAGHSIDEARAALREYRAERSRRAATNEAHANAGGDLCTEGADGCCSACGVSLGDPCELCGGNGYHRAGCSDPECEA